MIKACHWQREDGFVYVLAAVHSIAVFWVKSIAWNHFECYGSRGTCIWSPGRQYWQSKVTRSMAHCVSGSGRCFRLTHKVLTNIYKGTFAGWTAVTTVPRFGDARRLRHLPAHGKGPNHLLREQDEQCLVETATRRPWTAVTTVPRCWRC